MSKPEKKIKRERASRVVDSKLNLTEGAESAERTQADLKKSDPDDAGRVIAKLLDKTDKE
jgi:hypothetical protein